MSDEIKDLVERLRAGADAEEIAAIIVRIAAERDGAESRADMAEEAEFLTKDIFWAIYPDYLALGGQPISDEDAQQMASAKLAAAEAERDELKAERDRLAEALKPFADEVPLWASFADEEVLVEPFNDMAPDHSTLNVRHLRTASEALSSIKGRDG